MKAADLHDQIRAKQSFLLVGLDSDINRLPKHLLDLDDPIFAFNKAIIDATKDLCVGYKINLAFYEALGAKGWESLEKTVAYLPKDSFRLADAKRGDIGNTAAQYAQSIFGHLDFDAITLSPYMGSDSVTPFLAFEDKTVILLALTSNKSSADFQRFHNGERNLYEEIIRVSKTWGSEDQIMYVVGATHPEEFEIIRKHAPNHFLLVPGIGAQGGDLGAVVRYGKNQRCGLLVNSSRGIIFAGDGEDFADKAREAAQTLQQAMAAML